MECKPETVGERIPNCIDNGLIALRPRVKALCPNEVGSSQADIDMFVTGSLSGMDAISLCLRNVFRTVYDETLTPLLMKFSGDALVIKLNDNTHLLADVAYNFRVLVENPMGAFDNIKDRSRWWSIETREMSQPISQKFSRLSERYDLNYAIDSFPVYPRISLFVLQTLNYIGSAETNLKIAFDITYDLAPTKEIIITAPEEFTFKEYPNLSMAWSPTIDPATL